MHHGFVGTNNPSADPSQNQPRFAMGHPRFQMRPDTGFTPTAFSHPVNMPMYTPASIALSNAMGHMMPMAGGGYERVPTPLYYISHGFPGATLTANNLTSAANTLQSLYGMIGQQTYCHQPFNTRDLLQTTQIAQQIEHHQQQQHLANVHVSQQQQQQQQQQVMSTQHQQHQPQQQQTMVHPHQQQPQPLQQHPPHQTVQQPLHQQQPQQPPQQAPAPRLPRTTSRIPIVDPNTKIEITPRPPRPIAETAANSGRPNSTSSSSISRTPPLVADGGMSDTDSIILSASNSGTIVSQRADHVRHSSVAAVAPMPVSRDASLQCRGVVQSPSIVDDSASTALVIGVYQLIRSNAAAPVSSKERSSRKEYVNNLQSQNKAFVSRGPVIEANVAKEKSVAKPNDDAETKKSIGDPKKKLESEFEDMGFFSAVRDVTLTYENKNIVEDDSQEWLPSEMQAESDEEFVGSSSEDEEEYTEDTSAGVVFTPTAASKEEFDDKTTAGPVASTATTSGVIISGKSRFSRDFIINCYQNPTTKDKPADLPSSTVALQKPIEHLLDVLRKAMPMQHEPQNHHGPSSSRHRYQQHHTDYRHKVTLHQAENPYTLKSQMERTEEENKVRQFRSLMNKVTEENRERIMSKMMGLKLDQQHLYRDLLDVIFDKAVQEPSYCPTYAKVCDTLSKNLKSHKLEDKGQKKSTTFKAMLTALIQETFEKRITSEKEYALKSEELNSTNVEANKKRIRDELDEIKRNWKRKYMGNMKFIGELFNLKFLNMHVINGCLETMMNQDCIDWQYESICNLMKVIGPSLDASEESKSTVDKTFEKLRTAMLVISDNRIRFMIMDLLDLRKDKWHPKKQGRASVPQSVPSVSGLRTSRQPPSMSFSSGQAHRSQLRSQMTSSHSMYSGVRTSGQRYESPERTRTNFSFDPAEKLDGGPDNSVPSRYGRTSAAPDRKSSASTIKMHSTAAAGSKQHHHQQQQNPRDSTTTTASKHDSVKKNLEKIQEIVDQTKGFYKLDDITERLEKIVEVVQGDQATWEKLIPSMFEGVFDHNEEACVRLGLMLSTACCSNELQVSTLTKGIKSVWYIADDILLDVPRVFEMMGATLSNIFTTKGVDLVAILPEIFQPVASKPCTSKVLGMMLQLACKQISNEEVKKKLASVDFKLQEYADEDSLRNVLKDYKLEVLMGGGMYLEELYNLLTRYLPDKNCTDLELINLIEEKFSKEQYFTPKVIQPLFNAWLDSTIEIKHSKKTPFTYKSELFDKRVVFFRDFFRGQDFEDAAIQACTDYVIERENPYGLLQQLFTVLSQANVVSDAAFKRWKDDIQNDKHVSGCAGSLILTTKGFFEWLEKDDVEDTEDEICTVFTNDDDDDDADDDDDDNDEECGDDDKDLVEQRSGPVRRPSGSGSNQQCPKSTSSQSSIDQGSSHQQHRKGSHTDG